MRKIIGKKIFKVLGIFITFTFLLSYCFPHAIAKTGELNKIKLEIPNEFFSSSDFEDLSYFLSNNRKDIFIENLNSEKLINEFLNAQFHGDQFKVDEIFKVINETINSVTRDYTVYQGVDTTWFTECTSPPSINDLLLLYVIVDTIGIAIILVGFLAQAFFPSLAVEVCLGDFFCIPTSPGTAGLIAGGLFIIYYNLAAFFDFLGKLSLGSPEVAIISPTDGSTFNQGESINFEVSVLNYGEDWEYLLIQPGWCSWSSSKDGEIGCGIEFSTYDFSTGSHTISVRCLAPYGVEAGEASVNITIE